MSMDKPDNTTAKKQYSKPEVIEVSLRPEEAVLGSCKTKRISGPGQGACSVPSSCSSLAS